MLSLYYTKQVVEREIYLQT